MTPMPAHWLLLLPLLVPLLVAGLALTAWRRRRLQQILSLCGAAALLITAGLILAALQTSPLPVVRLGSWPAPVGIPLGADHLTALMLGLSALMTAVTLVYLVGSPSQGPFLVPLMMVTVLGVNGAFLTRDLFNLYVWFEVLLAGSFGLLVVTGGKLGREAAVKSLTLNLMGSLIFLLAVGVTYGLAGTLDMFELQQRLAVLHAERPAAVTGVAMLLLAAFAIKAALFPFHFWLPASYHVPSAGICALFAALLTKVGIYSLLRLLTLPFGAVEGPETVLGVLAGLTMLVGVFGAVTRFEIKAILAWHSISQIGYMAAGFALLAAPSVEVRLAGLVATVFFVLHHGLVKPALFLVAGLVKQLQGSTDLGRLGGLHRSRPLLAVAFLLSALSLVGIPPLSGFWAKLGLVQALFQGGQGWLLAAALGASVVTLLSMVKIWSEAFWKPLPEREESVSPVGAPPVGRWVATLGLVAVVTLLGLIPRPTLDLVEQAAVTLNADRARAGETEPALAASAEERR
ncbi:MAG: proton-conducting transporter membrane subunit [Myxococcota bacterium]|nr:proton-conducting transporter membrane subunit [Myxococcota bacterium]